MYKVHNDFIEIFTEIGLFGGIAYLSIFLFVFWSFGKRFLYQKTSSKDSEKSSYFFLPFFGLLTYSFDAFFNFPQDRPEIQTLFAIYVGIGVAIGYFYLNQKLQLTFLSKLKNTRLLQFLFVSVLLLGMVGSSYVLSMYFQSLKIQRIVKQETNSGKLRSTSDFIIKNFPPVPSLNAFAEPINVQIARYLINEKKYEEARECLRNDHSNPFDGRKEYFIASTFNTEKKYDSALHYAKIANKIKPVFYNNNTIAASIYEKKGQFQKSLDIWERYLEGDKEREKVWVIVSSLYSRLNKQEKALEVIDSALVYLPKSEVLKKRRQSLLLSVKYKDAFPIYNQANTIYKSKKDYPKAIELFTKFLEKAPDYMEAYRLRAFSYYSIKDYKNALTDVNRFEALRGDLTPNTMNLKASCLYILGKKDQAKSIFEKAALAGNKDAASNYKKLYKATVKKTKSVAPPSNLLKK